MFCPNCGAKIKDGEKFCGKCGTPVKESKGKRQAKADSFTSAVALAKAGNNDGYTYLYEQTYKSKYYLALKYMDTKEAAEDVLQDAYVKAFSRLDTLSDPESFPSWFGTIVANTAKDALQKKNPVLFTDMSTGDEDLDEQELQIPDEDLSKQPEAAYTKQETSEMVQEMIGCLSEEQKMCILMYYIDGESIKDIASALGCSENTVKSRLNYGRKNLRAEADEMQKKGYKLYGLAPLPLLLLLLHLETGFMESAGALGAGMSAMEGAVLATTGSAAAAGTAAGIESAAAAGSAAGVEGAAAAGSAAGVEGAAAAGGAAEVGSAAAAGGAAEVGSAAATGSVAATESAAAATGGAVGAGGAAAGGSAAAAGAGNVSAAAAHTAAGAAGQGFIHTTAGHIAAGATAVVVGAGAVFGGVMLYNNNQEEPEPAEPVVEAEVIEREGTATVIEEPILDPVTDSGDYEVSPVTFVWDYMTREAIEEGLSDFNDPGTSSGYCATLTITNNEDEAYAATVKYEYLHSDMFGEGTYKDEYTYYLAPHETRQVSYYLRAETGDETEAYSYTGNWEISYEPYDGGTLPVSSVTNVSLSSQDFGEVYATFTIPNTTSEDWKDCTVNYDVLYQGMYAGSFKAKAEDIKAGEDAVLSEDLNDLSLYGYVGAAVNPDIIKDKIEIIVTNIRYSTE